MAYDGVDLSSYIWCMIDMEIYLWWRLFVMSLVYMLIHCVSWPELHCYLLALALKKATSNSGCLGRCFWGRASDL